jgi:putative toxin-antitoxin system antitoxin component (TIGR02293 family)
MYENPIYGQDRLMPVHPTSEGVLMAEEPMVVAATSPFETILQVREGFSPLFLERLAQKLSITNEVLASLLGTSAVSLSRWANSGKRLDARISETALKIQELYNLAEEVFGSAPDAVRWFKTANFGLANQRPLDLLDTETGRGMVRRQLMAIKHSLGF